MAVVEVRAAGLVVFRKAVQGFEYLLMQHSYGENHWTPPKGHVDPGESDFETALRETEEEAGLVKKDLKIISDFKKEVRYQANNKPKVVTYWLAEIIGNPEVKLSHEHKAYKWVEVNKAVELCTKHVSSQELLRECQSFLEKNYDTIKSQNS